MEVDPMIHGVCGDWSVGRLVPFGSCSFINALQAFHEKAHEIPDFRDIEIFRR